MTRKRVLDLALGIPLAIAATPVICILTVLVFLTSGWPPLIVQTRVGAGERPIRILKLRTMARRVPVVAKSDLLRSEFGQRDGLYTPLGPLMRRLSLDELPQIYHVLAGEMSLVGPRPALASQHDLLSLRRRHRVTSMKPGLTGLAQIEGRESLTLATKVRFEAHYIEHTSVCYDLLIIARTFKAIVSRRGAF